MKIKLNWNDDFNFDTISWVSRYSTSNKENQFVVYWMKFCLEISWKRVKKNNE